MSFFFHPRALLANNKLKEIIRKLLDPVLRLRLSHMDQPALPGFCGILPMGPGYVIEDLSQVVVLRIILRTAGSHRFTCSFFDAP